MHLPTITGLIRRRVLVNYAADPSVVTKLLPAPLAPKVVDGRAVVGICLIRLEQLRPRPVPAALGLTSENAAHRIAVTLADGRDAVYIPRRDTDSPLNVLAGGRLFPGEHHRADFEVHDDARSLTLTMRARDGSAAVSLQATPTPTLASLLFDSLDEASLFFRAGSLGYSARTTADRLDAIRLAATTWNMAPLAVDHVSSTWFEDETRFPRGSLAFDSALVMRDLPHEWHEEPSLPLP